MGTKNETSNKRIVSTLKNQISRLRVIVYIFMATSVLLTSLVVFWAYSPDQDALDAIYSEAPNPPRASLYLSPKEGHYNVGDEFSVDVLINTRGSNVVAVAAYLSYDKNLMKAESVDISGSIFDIVFENKINEKDGKIKIGIGKPTPGVNIPNGKIARIHFTALKKNDPLMENIYFDFTKGSSLYSAIILDDKKGTNILNATRGVKIFID